MTEKPDFSCDTGAGRPGIDNLHIPGRAYSSHAVEDTGCAICRQCVGYWEHDGVLLYGTEGQRVEYIWIARGNDVPPKCTICDACLEVIVASGKVEMIHNTDGIQPDDLSTAGRRELFTLGARDTLARFNEIQISDALCSAFILPPNVAEITAAMTFAAVIGAMRDPYLAGAQYAAAALGFGLVERDPGFEAAAAFYVSKYSHCGLTEAELQDISEHDRLIDTLWEASPNKK
jgi:hypothetical protein